MKNSKLYLVDASSLFFRAFYAIRPLSNAQGLPTNAVYGFLTMILKLVKDESPDYLIFCYDRKEPSFRKDIYPEYKANRSEMPEDLIPQIPYIYRLAETLGIRGLQKEGFEADDLIGAFAEWGVKHNCQVSIVSGDKDFAQLVKPGIELLDTMKEARLDSNAVFAKWGVRPDQMIDYLALVGDSSDNVPGVPGVGPKTATKLLEDYQTLDGVYQNIVSVKGNLAEKLKNNRDLAYLSQKLVTIVTDIPELTQNLNLDDFKIQQTSLENLRQLMNELGFKNMDKSMEQWSRGELKSDAKNDRASMKTSNIVSPQVEDDLIQKNEASSLIPEIPQMPVELLSSTNIKEHIKSGQTLWVWIFQEQIFLADSEKKIIYKWESLPSEFGPAVMGTLLFWKAYDLKEIWHKLELEEMPSSSAAFDARLAAYILKPGRPVELAEVLQEYAPEYAAFTFDVQQVFAAFQKLEEVLLKRMSQDTGARLFREVELPLVTILYAMERRGFGLDAYSLREQSEELGKILEKLETEIYADVGETFNLNSPKQLSVILFEKLGLPAKKKTKTGYSTDNDVLSELADQHVSVKKLLQYREYSKLKSTYLDALPLLRDSRGRVHTTFHQALTATGRLSSSNPNLQNIPIRTERGARIRKAFVADSGKLLLSVDYSQIELRILAHFSEDVNLSKAFMADLDVHAATASEVFSVPLLEVTSEQRRTAKAINFGIAYGQGAFGLAENLGVSRAEASQIIKRYFEKFPGVGRYIETTIESAKAKGYTESLFGRRRYMEEFKSSVSSVRKFGERAAINAPIQGTSSDIVKMAMVNVAREVPLNMVLQVHDELIFEGREDEIHKWQPQIVDLMENVAKLRVPLKVNSSVGKNWDDAH